MSDVIHIYGSSYDTCPLCGHRCPFDSASNSFSGEPIIRPAYWEVELQCPERGVVSRISWGFDPAGIKTLLRKMKASFEEVLIAVWRQTLKENAGVVKLGAERYPVTRSKTKRLRQVAFMFDGNTIMGIEQNPKTKSRWAQMARAGKKVMQFIQDGRYMAVVADGKMILYGKRNA
jgi:hypothetical protein